MKQQSPTNNRYCPNCHYPLARIGEFCSNCGQKYTDGRVTFMDLMREFFDAIFNFDSKIFNTLRAILVPGKLTNEYFKGRHKRYLHPVRFFLIMTILHLFIIGFLVSGEMQKGLNEVKAGFLDQGYRADFLEEFDSSRNQVVSKFNDQAMAGEVLDTMRREMAPQDDREVQITYPKRDENGRWKLENQDIPQTEIGRLSAEAIMDKHEINQWLGRFVATQNIKVYKEVDNFAQFMLGKLSWMILLMMPALALVLKLLYIRRRRYYLEHLVFSFHYHSFAFLIMSVGLLLDDWRGADSGTFSGFALLIILVYLFRAMRRVYRQKWFKTFVKFNILNFTYFFIFLFASTLTFVLGALTY